MPRGCNSKLYGGSPKKRRGVHLRGGQMACVHYDGLGAQGVHMNGMYGLHKYTQQEFINLCAAAGIRGGATGNFISCMKNTGANFFFDCADSEYPHDQIIFKRDDELAVMPIDPGRRIGFKYVLNEETDKVKLQFMFKAN